MIAYPDTYDIDVAYDELVRNTRYIPVIYIDLIAVISCEHCGEVLERVDVTDKNVEELGEIFGRASEHVLSCANKPETIIKTLTALKKPFDDSHPTAVILENLIEEQEKKLCHQ